MHDRPTGETPIGGNRPGDVTQRPPGTRPGTGDLAGSGQRPRIGSQPARPGVGEGVGPGGQPVDGNRPLRPGEGGRGDYRPNRVDNWGQRSEARRNNWTGVNNNWDNKWRDNWHDCGNWYGRDWWNKHPVNGYQWPANANWWAAAAWPAVTSWMPWGWSQPTYYNYGENVYYEGDAVYYGDQQVATADEYSQQAEAIAASKPADAQPAAEDWMPLGVFAVTQDGESANDDPTMFLQLAVSKQGIIAGTYQNTTAGTVKSMEGMVDKETQRVAWGPVGESYPLMETGLGNLTQDTAGALVHFANGDTQQWLLVRLNKPEGAGAAK